MSELSDRSLSGLELWTKPFIKLVTQGFGIKTNPIPKFLFFAFLQRQGRCDTYATEFDLEAEEYVPLPKGDVHKKKEIIQDVTLHDLDVANARPQVSNYTDEILTEKSIVHSSDCF